MWVACRAAADLAKIGQAIDISVNVASRQLLHPDFVQKVAGVLERTGLPVGRLMLEITESAIINVALGNNLGLGVIAEGVETGKHTEFLCRHHCYLQQGYYFSRPVSTTQLMQFMGSFRIDREMPDSFSIIFEKQ